MTAEAGRVDSLGRGRPVLQNRYAGKEELAASQCHISHSRRRQAMSAIVSHISLSPKERNRGDISGCQVLFCPINRSSAFQKKRPLPPPYLQACARAHNLPACVRQSLILFLPILLFRILLAKSRRVKTFFGWKGGGVKGGLFRPDLAKFWPRTDVKCGPMMRTKEGDKEHTSITGVNTGYAPRGEGMEKYTCERLEKSNRINNPSNFSFQAPVGGAKWGFFGGKGVDRL